MDQPPLTVSPTQGKRRRRGKKPRNLSTNEATTLPQQSSSSSIAPTQHRQSSVSASDQGTPLAPTPTVSVRGGRLWPVNFEPLNTAFQDFYEAIALLHALDPTRDGPPEHSRAPDPQSPTYRRDLLRDFLNSIALICDTQKAGTTCTAAALLNVEGQNVLLLASNNGIPERTLEEVKRIINSLASLYGKPKSTEQVMEKQFCKLFGELNDSGPNPRITSYIKFLYKQFENLKVSETFISQFQPDIKRSCTELFEYLGRMFTEIDQQGKDNIVARFLKPTGGFFEISSGGVQRVIMQCNTLVKSRQMNKISEHLENNNITAEHFRNLRHNVGRLAQYHRLFVNLINAARGRPELFWNMEIEVLDASIPMRGTLDKSTNPSSVLNRIFLDDPDRTDPLMDGPKQQMYLSGLSQQYQLLEFFNTNINSINTNGYLRVHAELLLLNHIANGNFEFVEAADRFIGCSKPACYLCSTYAAGFENYTLRDSHNKLYLGWRLPENENDRVSQFHLREMTFKIRRAIIRHLLEEKQRRKAHKDSTSGYTKETYRTDMPGLRSVSSMDNIWNSGHSNDEYEDVEAYYHSADEF